MATEEVREVVIDETTQFGSHYRYGNPYNRLEASGPWERPDSTARVIFREVEAELRVELEGEVRAMIEEDIRKEVAWLDVKTDTACNDDMSVPLVSGTGRQGRRYYVYHQQWVERQRITIAKSIALLDRSVDA